MSYETGWCDDCGVPIGIGPCRGCLAYSSVCADLDDWPDDADADDDIDEIDEQLEGWPCRAGFAPNLAPEKIMSIDARVKTVVHNEDGSGVLVLIDRPARPGRTPGIAGQSALKYDTAPHEVTALNGLDVWGGASSLMLGEVEIARREGYTRIVFHDDETFKRAVAEYHRTR